MRSQSCWGLTPQVFVARGIPPVARSRPIIGVDVGGTKIAAALVRERGCISNRVRRATPVGSAAETLKAIEQTARMVLDDAGLDAEQVSGVGLGIPGLVEPETGVAIASVNLGWQDVAVKASLEAALGMRCAVENDVKAAALGEIKYGAARGLRNIIYLVIGTGIAAGIVIDGKLLRGAHGVAGEIGHAILRPSGPLCKCGARGCMEVLVAGPAIAERVQQWPVDGDDGSVASDSLEAEEVFAAVRAGDAAATETLGAVAADLAFALQFLLLAFDPEMVVLGGGVMESGEMILPAVLDRLSQQAAASWVFASLFEPSRIQVSEIQADIGILGAAALLTRY